MSRYYKSARHTMQLDQDIYFAELDRELRQGKNGRRLSVSITHATNPTSRRASGASAGGVTVSEAVPHLASLFSMGEVRS